MSRKLSGVILVAAIFALASGANAAPVKFLRSPHTCNGKITFAYHGDLWVADRDGSDPRRLTDHVANDARPRFSPDGQWIAFTSNRMGNNDAWIIPTVGGKARQLTFHSTNDSVHYWTPDGKGVIVSTSRGTGTWGSPLYVVPLDGGIPVPMGMDFASTGMIKQDGSMVAFNRNGYRGRRKHYVGNSSSDVWVQDLSTGQTTQLTDVDLMTARTHVQDAAPMWGADGMIYFTSERDGFFNLWKISPDGGDAAQVTFHNKDGVVNPAMSPDGETVIYENEFELWTIDVPDGKPEKVSVDLDFDDKNNLFEVLTTSNEADGFSPSPDGSYVAVDYHGEIFVVPTDQETGEKKQVTSSSWRERYERWSPDGKYIAYISDESLEEEIWLFDLATGSRRKLSNHESTKSNLKWSPDSKHIAFVAANTLFDIDVASGSTAQLAHNPEGGYRLSGYSADGKWMVYSRGDENLNTDVYLFNIAEKQEFNVTQDPFRDGGGALTADGKHVVFTSNRNGGTNHLFVVSLTKVTEDPNDPLVRERKKAEEGAGNEGRRGRGRGRGRRGAGEETEPEAEEQEEEVAEIDVQIDLEGIDRRAVQLTTGNTGVRSVFLSKDGKTIYYVSGGGGGRGRGRGRRGGGGGGGGGSAALNAIGIDGKNQRKVADGSFGGIIPTTDGELVFYREGRNIFKMPLTGRNKEQVNFALRVQVDTPGQWEQIFEEAWRVMKYRFYDENMHGFDWPAIKKEYKPQLAYVGANEDVYDLANEMIGELNASHVGVRGGATRSLPAAYQTALLGFEMEPDYMHYKVTHVYRDGPADKEWVDLKAGDYVLAIDGHPIKAGDNYWAILNHTLNDYVTLKVSSSTPNGNADAREVRIRTTNSLRNIKYQEWVENNRDWVEDYSEGKIAYLHIRSMNQASLVIFENEINRFWNAKGIVIDIRFNGGGNIDQQLLDILERRPYEYWNSRQGSRAAGRRPRQAIAGPKVMLINHRSGSDSEVTPLGFRDLGLGRIVGNPTAAAVIATGSYSLINGATIRTPGSLVAAYDPTQPNNYGINLENYGVPPDVWVENSPQDSREGLDRELKTAVDEALRMLASGVWQYDSTRDTDTNAANGGNGGGKK